MNRIPGELPERFDYEDLNSVVRRLGDAGWLEGKNYVNTEEIVIRYSKSGFTKMNAVHDFLKTFPQDFLRLPSAQTTDRLLELLLVIGKLEPSFVITPFSGKEWGAFIELALAFQFDSSPPPNEYPPI